MNSPLAVVTGTMLCALAFAGRAPAAEQFQKLSGAQVRAKLAGMEFSDGVHWRDVFERNGVLTGYSMGRKSVGKWSVHKDQLCLDRGQEPGSGCYDVWLSGNKVELRPVSGLPLEGVLQRASGGPSTPRSVE